MSQYLTYAKFYSEEEAKELATFLSEKGISFNIEEEKDLFDKIYVGESLDPLFVLKIEDTDFTRVNNLIITDFKVDTTQIAADYYLLGFSNDELRQVIDTPGEWNYYDRALAAKLLTGRNESISSNSSTGKEEGNYQPERIQAHWVVLEYLIAVIFGYAGIIIGVATLLAKKTLENGKSVKMYDEYTRTHGIFILLVGIGKILLFHLF